MQKVILSLFDYTGSWSKPYEDAGYKVIRIDIKNGIDILKWDYRNIPNVVGILAAPPCTDFALSGAQYWPVKDQDGRTAHSVALVKKTLEIVYYYKERGLLFWTLENPVGRIDKLVPELKKYRLLHFHPYEFGHPYSKYTVLWGEFCPFLTRHVVKPTMGSINVFHRSQEKRSITPSGFAKAFFTANQY